MTSANFSNQLMGYTLTDTRLLTSTYLFGTCTSWMLLSFVIVQAFTYFRYYKNDSKLLKSIVYVVIFLQLAQTALESYEAYVIDSAGWGYPAIILNLSSIIAEDLQSVLEPLTTFIVQCFFTWRIWMFCMALTSILHSKIRLFARLVCAFIALISALSLGAALAIGITSITADEFPWWFNTVIVLWNASSAVADITITICMMALLLHAKSGTHFGKTHDLLSRLTRIVLQTGLLTSILALLVLPLILRGVTGIYSLPWYILGKSQVISLLANLNARKRSNTPIVQGSGIIKLSTPAFAPGANHSIVSSLPVRSIVQINGQNGSITHADVAERSDQDIEVKMDGSVDTIQSTYQAYDV